MKTALITTSINVPTVLSLYRKCDPDVAFFVAADRKTPVEAYEFCSRLPNTVILSPEAQERWSCSASIGWNTISRRNIALLEALKWGADVIVTIDDDNIPLNNHYFGPIHHHFWGDSEADFSGLLVTNEWFDVGCLLHDYAPHRGFPHTKRDDVSFTHVVDAKVGVAAGVCLGDPDIDAATRITAHPVVTSVATPLISGIITDPRTTHTVFNSQNTAFIRELAPCFLMVPAFGRYDDIFASLLAQRVMREKDLYVHFGQPFVWQQRNAHDLLKDLRAEQWGAENILRFVDWLDGFQFQPNRSVLEMVQMVYGMANSLTNAAKWNCPDSVNKLGHDWVEDCASVL